MGQENEEQPQPTAFDVTALDTYVLIQLFINILASKAWQHMGLRIKPGTDTVEKDLERAKTAIDCISSLLEKVESHLQEKEARILRNLLSDLQINFVRAAED